MSTKNDPGTYDCYANAAPDEPMFVLLGRDRHAPLLVRLWAALREADGEDAAKVEEALGCSTDMVHWQVDKGKHPFTNRAVLMEVLRSSTYL